MTPETHAMLSALLPKLFPGSSPAALGAGLETLRDHSDLGAVAAACACALAGDHPRRMYAYRLAHPILVTGPAAERLRAKPPATPAQRARYADHARRRLAGAARRTDPTPPTDRKDTHP